MLFLPLSYNYLLSLFFPSLLEWFLLTVACVIAYNPNLPPTLFPFSLTFFLSYLLLPTYAVHSHTMDFTRTHLIFSRLVNLVADTVLGRINEPDTGAGTCHVNRQRNQTSQVLAVWDRYLTATITPSRTPKPEKRPRTPVDLVDAHLTSQQRIQWKLDHQQCPTDSISQQATLHAIDNFHREVERRELRREADRQRRQQRHQDRRVRQLRQTVCRQRDCRQQWEEWGNRCAGELRTQREAKRAIRESGQGQIRIVMRPSPVVPAVAPVVVAPVVAPIAEEGHFVEVFRRRRKNKKKWVAPEKDKGAGGS